MRAAADRIRHMGPRVVIVKGGHLEADRDESVDILCTAAGAIEIRGARLDTPHTHGTGCAFSAALAAGLALGLEPITSLARRSSLEDVFLRLTGRQLGD